MTDELVKVAQLDQLPPGGRNLCTVADRRIALFHLDGTIYAIDNHCTHRDGPVGAAEMKPVGTYAYTIAFSDSHSTGIYTFDLLQRLGEEMHSGEQLDVTHKKP